MKLFNFDMPGVYCIENRKTKQKYIGQTSRIGYRLNEHMRQLQEGTHPNPKLQDAFNNNGRFNVFVLCYEPNLDERLKKEQYYISLYDSINNGYNQLSHFEKRAKLKRLA
jgi:group I intron endonuclease